MFHPKDFIIVVDKSHPYYVKLRVGAFRDRTLMIDAKLYRDMEESVHQDILRDVKAKLMYDIYGELEPIFHDMMLEVKSGIFNYDQQQKIMEYAHRISNKLRGRD